MPQLNPTPWLAILVLSWLIFITVLPPKVLAHLSPNKPTSQNTQKSQMEPWAWPWH